MSRNDANGGTKREREVCHSEQPKYLTYVTVLICQDETLKCEIIYNSIQMQQNNL